MHYGRLRGGPLPCCTAAAAFMSLLPAACCGSARRACILGPPAGNKNESSHDSCLPSQHSSHTPGLPMSISPPLTA